MSADVVELKAPHHHDVLGDKQQQEDEEQERKWQQFQQEGPFLMETMNQELERDQALLRLKAALELESNKVCAECAEPDPTWAFLLENPVEEEGPRLGITCCYKCYGNHMRLGSDVGEIKSLRKTQQWTEEEIKVLASTGNEIVNYIYESKVTSQVVSKKKKDMESFIRNKYKELKYFSNKKYQQHFKGTHPTSSGFLGSKLMGPSFDWTNFSKHSSSGGPSEYDNLDASTHSTSSFASTSNKIRGLSKGLGKTLMNPFATAEGEIGVTPQPPSLRKAVSSPLSLMGGLEDSTAKVTTKITKLYGTPAAPSESVSRVGAGTADGEGDAPISLFKKSSSLLDSESEDEEAEEDFQPDLSFLAKHTTQQTRRNCRLKSNNPHSLDFLKDQRGEKDTEDASVQSSRSKRSTSGLHSRRGRKVLSAPNINRATSTSNINPGGANATWEKAPSMRWDLYRPGDEGGESNGSKAEKIPRTPGRLRRGVVASRSNPSVLDAMRHDIGAGKTKPITRATSTGKTIPRASSISGRRRKPASSSGLDADDDNSSEDKEESSEQKAKKNSSRVGRLDSKGEGSSRKGRSSRDILGASEESKGGDEDSESIDGSNRGEKSKSSGRARPRKVSPTSPIRNFRSLEKEHQRSPRRTPTDSSLAPKPSVRRQLSAPIPLLDDSLLDQSNAEDVETKKPVRRSRSTGRVDATSGHSKHSHTSLDQSSKHGSKSRRRTSGNKNLGDLAGDSSHHGSKSPRRSSGKKKLGLDAGSIHQESKSPRRSSGKKKLGIDSGSRSPRSSRSPGKERPSLEGEKKRSGSLFDGDLPELAQIIISGRRGSDKSLLTETKKRLSQSLHSSNSSLLDTMMKYPDSPDSSESEASFGMDERSPPPHLDGNPAVSEVQDDIGGEQENDDNLPKRSNSPKASGDQMEGQNPTKNDMVRRVNSLDSKKKLKGVMSLSHSLQKDTKTSGSKESRKSPAKKEETLNDTILALEAIGKTNVNVDTSVKLLAMQK